MKQKSRKMEAESSLPVLGSWWMPDCGTGLFSGIAGEKGKLGSGREQKQKKNIKGITYSLLVPTEAGRRRHTQTESHLLISSYRAEQ